MSKSSLEVVMLEDRGTPSGLLLIGKTVLVGLNSLPPADPTSPPVSPPPSGGGATSPPPPVSPPVTGTT